MVEDLVQTLRQRAAPLRGLNARVRFVLSDGSGSITVTAGNADVRVDADGGGDLDAADCTIRLSPDNLDKLVAGRLNPMLAFTMGKLKVDGSKTVAMKLAALLDE